MSQTIVLVGHCGIDGPRLQTVVSQCLKGCEVLRVNKQGDLEAACEEGADLMLVNREPVGFDGTEGLDLIRQLRERYPEQKVMLVSDFSEAQQEATAAGALPGFGKRDIGSPKLEQCIKQALA